LRFFLKHGARNEGKPEMTAFEQRTTRVPRGTTKNRSRGEGTGGNTHCATKIQQRVTPKKAPLVQIFRQETARTIKKRDIQPSSSLPPEPHYTSFSEPLPGQRLFSITLQIAISGKVSLRPLAEALHESIIPSKAMDLQPSIDPKHSRWPPQRSYILSNSSSTKQTTDTAIRRPPQNGPFARLDLLIDLHPLPPLPRLACEQATSPH